MVFNAAARNLNVIIGGQDWSDRLIRSEIGRDSFDESGLVKITGSLLLNPPPGTDPRDQQSFWFIGQTVNLSPHPLGHLYLLDIPDPPVDFLELRVGCILALKDIANLAGDATTVPGPTNSAIVTNQLFVAGGVTSTSLSSFPYSLTLSIPKEGQESYVAQAGQLAFSNHKHLFQNQLGVVEDAELDFDGAAVVTIQLGVNESEYTPFKADPAPAFLYRAAGIHNFEIDAETQVTTTEESGDRSVYETGSASCPGTGVVLRSQTSISWDVPNRRIIERTRSWAPRSSVFLDSEWSGGGSPCDLIEWQRVTKTRQFGVDDLLASITTETEQRRFTLSTTRANALAWITAQQSTQQFSYVGNQVSRAVTVTREVPIIRDPSTNSFSLVTVGSLDERWLEIGGRYQVSTIERLARVLSQDTLSDDEVDPFALVTRASTEISPSGPPRTETWDRGKVQNSVEVQGSYIYAPESGSVGQSERFIRVPFGFSDSQCDRICREALSIQLGRHMAYEISLEIETLPDSPLFRLDVVESPNVTRRFLGDGLVITHTPESSEALCTGIWLGSTVGGVEIPANPNLWQISAENMLLSGELVYV